MPSVINGSDGIDSANLVNANHIQMGTAVATTSGTYVDFTGIPSWAKRITITIYGLGTSGTSYKILRIGAGTLDTAGYFSSSTYIAAATVASTSNTTGFIFGGTAAADTLSGTIVLTKLDGNTWICDGKLAFTNTAGTLTNAGDKTLAGALTMLRITTVNGTDTFDNGSINIIWEG